VEFYRDIHPIHGWRSNNLLTVLGENRPVGKSIKSNLVLVVRGDLLRRYPNTDVYAVNAIPNPAPRDQTTVFANSKRREGSQVERPLFQARFGRDVFCYGFNLTKEQVMGTSVDAGTDLGWYFVLAERFGEPRFGLDEPENPADDFGRQAPTLLEVSWAHLANDQAAYDALLNIDLNAHTVKTPAGGFVSPGSGPAKWNDTAAGTAAIFLQLPFRLFFHAGKMLKEEPGA